MDIMGEIHFSEPEEVLVVIELSTIPTWLVGLVSTHHAQMRVPTTHEILISVSHVRIVLVSTSTRLLGLRSSDPKVFPVNPLNVACLTLQIGSFHWL